MINEEAMNKNIITACPTENITLSVTGSYIKIPLDNMLVVGNQLTIKNNSVVCGKNGFVKVSGKVSFNSSPTAGLKWLTIHKSGSAVSANPFYNTGVRTTLSTPPLLVAVKSGDSITLEILGTKDDLIRAGIGYTELTVEYVN